MNPPDILATQGDRARGDQVADAGRSLRGILRDRSRYEKASQVLTIISLLIVAATIGVVVLAILGHVTAAMWVAGLSLGVAVACSFASATQGATAVLASASMAAIGTVAAAVSTGAAWWEALAGLAAIGLTLIPMNKRRTRVPMLPVVAGGQWSIVVLMLLGQWIGVAAPIAAVALAIAVVYIVPDRAADVRVAAAKQRSAISAELYSEEGTIVGVKVPPAMSERNIAVGIEAEQATAEQLATLGPEYIVLHSRKIRHSAADLDHLVIGPHGVALVDSKFRAGEMTYREMDFRDVTDDVVPVGQLSAEAAEGQPLAPLEEAAVDAAMKARDEAPDDSPDEALSEAALEARQRAYEVFRVAEFAGQSEQVGEWYLNGFPASAALASSTSWEASQIEKALKMPDEVRMPVLLSIHGARLDRPSASIPLFTASGIYEREALVTHSAGIADAIRELPRIIDDPSKIDDLAVVVDDLFPRYK